MDANAPGEKPVPETLMTSPLLSPEQTGEDGLELCTWYRRLLRQRQRVSACGSRGGGGGGTAADHERIGERGSTQEGIVVVLAHQRTHKYRIAVDCIPGD